MAMTTTVDNQTLKFRERVLISTTNIILPDEMERRKSAVEQKKFNL